VKIYITSMKVRDVRRKASSEFAFDSSKIVDAPEHHELSRALGVLTWGTWDHGVRPFEQRLAEFLAAFPPGDPLKNMNRGLSLQADGYYGPATRAEALDRFLAADGRSGSLHEILGRYGLKLASARPKPRREFSPGDFRETARSRNQKLRALHGGVDIEPQNMDAAKAELLDRVEKQRAAQDVRKARERMRADLAGEKSKK
jgi:hypothetical protein